MKLFEKLKSIFKKKENVTNDTTFVEPEESKQIEITKEATPSEEVYYERTQEPKVRFNLKSFKTRKEKLQEFEKATKVIETKLKTADHDYSFLKLFSLAATKDRDYNDYMNNLKKDISKCLGSYKKFSDKLELLDYEELTSDELDSLSLELNDFLNAVDDIDYEVRNIKGKYYYQLRMSSYSICSDKSAKEINQLDKDIKDLIKNYKHINEAYDVIYYNSGELIVNTINALVECISNSKNENLKKQYDYKYFLNTDAVVALDFNEWIALFTKMKYVMRISKNTELFNYLKFRELYNELEKRYVLMLIFNEMIV